VREGLRRILVRPQIVFENVGSWVSRLFLGESPLWQGGDHARRVHEA